MMNNRKTNSSQETIQFILKQGDFFYQQHKYSEALTWYNKGLKLNNKDVTFLLRKGNTYVQLKQWRKAYHCYVDVLIRKRIIDLLDGYIQQNPETLRDDITRFTNLFFYKYDLPIIYKGVEILLQQMRNEYNDIQRLKTWKKFEQKIEKNHLNIPDIIDVFVKEFGENYPVHFFSLYCHLWKYKGFSQSTIMLVDMILDHKRLLELESFEKFIRGNVKTKGKKLDRLSGIQFEKFLAVMFKSLGYQVTQTPASYDQGADLILNRLGETIVVQAKRWKQAVGNASIQQIVTAKQVHHAHRAMVITTSHFTKPAEKLAEKLGVELWDRNRLLDIIQNPSYLLTNSFLTSI